MGGGTVTEQANAPALAVTNLSFTYPFSSAPVLQNVSFSIEAGAFVLLVGQTGSGKTTLLRLLKPEVSPAGTRTGRATAFGCDVQTLAPAQSAATLGFVFQDPGGQLVCDTVRRELAFGLENLGLPAPEMRRRMAETCYFLGIGDWLDLPVASLSAGRRQLVALAGMLLMRPRLLLLDEPTSMLDPVAEQHFLSALARTRTELGVTVLLATHRPAALVKHATGALRVGGGMVSPVPLKALAAEPPLVARPGTGDTGASGGAAASGGATTRQPAPGGAAPVLNLSHLWFRYGREAPWIFRDASFSLGEGEICALMGANASGKSTLILLAAGVLRPQHGRVENRLHQSQALLPQDPKALLSQQSVGEELLEWSAPAGYTAGDVQNMLRHLGLPGHAGQGVPGDVPGDAPEDAPGDVAAGTPADATARAREQQFLSRHPYDLSAGQQQLLALGKLLLTRPRLLFLDEPTKGLDHHARELLARALLAARSRGTTILMATHDAAFARQVADSVALLFDGEVALSEPCGQFFQKSWVWRT